MNNTIFQFINRAELEILDQIEERFISIKNHSIQQLQTFPNFSIEKFSSNKFSIPTNHFLVQLITELRFYFCRLIEILIDLSYHIQQSKTNLNTIQTLLLSYIDILNEYHQQRCHLSSSNQISEFDQKLSNELSHMANEIINQLNTISLPNDSICIIRDT
jgi:hypothetical protein